MLRATVSSRFGSRVRSRGLRYVVVLVLVGVAAGGCSGGSASRPDALRDVSRTDRELRSAVSYLRTQRSSIDVTSLLIFDYMARRWTVRGLAEFRRYAHRLPGAMSSSNAFVRLFGPRRHPSPAALAAVRDTDTVTATVLECEKTPLGNPFASRLRGAVRAGGYQATHVLLALRWARDLGCHFSGEDKIREGAIRRVASELRSAETVTDLSTEQAAFLAELGAIRRIRSDWPERVRSAQRSDGGWAEDPAATPIGDHDPTRSNFHSTGLALWYLLAVAEAGAVSTRMVPR